MVRPFVYRLLLARRPPLKLIAQIRWCAFNGQRVGSRIPENALAQQHGIEINRQPAAATGVFG